MTIVFIKHYPVIQNLTIYFSSREHKDIKKAYDTIGFRNFFPILDMIFATNSSLPTNLQKKLRDLYPKLKVCTLVLMRSFSEATLGSVYTKRQRRVCDCRSDIAPNKM